LGDLCDQGDAGCQSLSNDDIHFAHVICDQGKRIGCGNFCSQGDEPPSGLTIIGRCNRVLRGVLRARSSEQRLCGRSVALQSLARSRPCRACGWHPFARHGRGLRRSEALPGGMAAEKMHAC
jgi:hypothetical protein